MGGACSIHRGDYKCVWNYCRKSWRK